MSRYPFAGRIDIPDSVPLTGAGLENLREQFPKTTTVVERNADPEPLDGLKEDQEPHARRPA